MWKENFKSNNSLQKVGESNRQGRTEDSNAGIIVPLPTHKHDGPGPLMGNHPS